MARKLFGRFVAIASSLGTSCVLLVLLGLLTWLGTLEQTTSGLFDVQRKYFESFVLVHHFGPVPIPLPGANLVMCLLFVNIVVGGLLRVRKSWATAGVIVAHVGIVLLLASALVKHRLSEDGHVTLYEGQSADHFESWVRWEIAVVEDLGGGRVREHLVPHERIEEAESRPVRLTSGKLPFVLEIEHMSRNCRPQLVADAGTSPLSSGAVEGVRLSDRAVDPQAEANIAGGCVAIVDDSNGVRRRALVWGAEAKPFTFVAAGRSWAISLRKERYAMPFSIALEHFTKEDHPRSDMPKSFASDVRVTAGSTSRDVRISMNDPLRDGGLVLYQASWGPSNARPGDRLFSTFAVVRNPADHWPLWACLVIGAGLVFHMGRKLMRYVRYEARSA